jgi:hypothetical protein
MILDKRDPQVNMFIEPWWRHNIPHIHKVLTLSEETDREIGKACEKVYTENSFRNKLQYLFCFILIHSSQFPFRCE